MAEDAKDAEERTCFKCGGLPLAEGNILCVSCREFLTTRTAGEIYAALPH